MPPLRQPRGPVGPSRLRTHRILADHRPRGSRHAGRLVAQRAAGGGPRRRILLLAMGAGFVAADLLDLRGRGRTAVLVTALTIAAAIPVVAALFEPGAAAILMAPIAFILVLPARPRAAARARRRGRRGPHGARGGDIHPLVGTAADPSGDRSATRSRSSRASGPSRPCCSCSRGRQTVHARRRRAASARLLAELPIGVARTDPQGRLVEANGAFARMYGYPDPASMIGMASRATRRRPGRAPRRGGRAGRVRPGREPDRGPAAGRQHLLDPVDEPRGP